MEQKMKFFNPTTELKELLLLQHIEKNPDTTQKAIASVIDAAPSMVNLYIDNLEEKNHMNRDYKSAKTVNYHITLEGIKRKNYLSIRYFHELLALYRLAEQNIEDFLRKIEEKGCKKVLFYGAGEVAETILGIIKARTDKNLQVLAIVDDKEELQGMSLLGYKIIPRDEIEDYTHDAVVITSYTFEDDIKDQLKEIGYPKEKIEFFFSEG